MIFKGRERKVYFTLMGVAVFLMVLGFITVNKTLCNLDVSTPTTWKVGFSNPKLTVGDDANARVVNKQDKLDFRVLLKKYGDVYTFKTKILNAGNFNAELSDVYLSELDSVVGTSKVSGRTYTIADYVTYSVTYESDNIYNEISKDSELKSGDKLHALTNNDIEVNIKYKDILDLSDDALIVLKDNVKTTNIKGYDYYAFDVDLSLRVVYKAV